MAGSSDEAVGLTEPVVPQELLDLIRRYDAPLRRYFRRKADASMVEDLTQEVFLRLHVASKQHTLENVERFIFTIAKRVLIDRQRFEGRHVAGLPFLEEDEDRDRLSPERIVSAKQDYQLALKAIIGLPPRMRLAFMLHRFSELSYSVIAVRMGISKPTVQTLVDRSLERIVLTLREKS